MAADDALYVAKREGKGRYAVSDASSSGPEQGLRASA
jgi:hypothetical protein